MDLIYSRHEETYIFLTIILVRKLSFILYQISLCSKFLIYNKMFADFKYVILLTCILFLFFYLFRKIVNRSISRLSHRSNSAELGQPFLAYLQESSSNHRRISFATSTKFNTYPERRGNSVKHHGRRHLNISDENQQRINSISYGHRLITC